MCRQINYRDGSPLTEVTTKELRKMLNKAWDMGKMAEWYFNTTNSIQPKRYRDVSKIIKEAEKAKEEQP